MILHGGLFHVKHKKSAFSCKWGCLMKKILCLFLLTALLAVFCGCENVEYGSDASVVPPADSSDVYEELVSQLPDLPPEYQGASYVIATNATEYFFAEEGSSGTVSRAVEERNRFLEEKYGVTVEVKAVSDSKVVSEVKNAVSAGEEYCDVLSVAAKKTAELALAGLLTDMNTLPGFDATADYFDQRTATSLATNSTLYLLPDPSNIVYENANVVFFNRELIRNAGHTSPETLAAQGKWTWDAMYEIMADTCTTLDKSSADLKTDTYGFGAYERTGTFPVVMWAACGTPFTGNTYKNTVTLALTEEEITEKTTQLRGYYNTRALMPLEKNDLADAFEEGRLVFMFHRLEYLHGIRDGGTDGSEFGFVPMPKLDESQQDYYCYVDNGCRVFSVPKGIKDPQKTSTLLTATCAAGGRTVQDAFVKSYIALYMNSNAETMMLKTVVDSICFDFCAVYGTQDSHIRAASTEALINCLDYGSSIKNIFSTRLQAFLDALDENFNKSS